MSRFNSPSISSQIGDFFVGLGEKICRPWQAGLTIIAIFVSLFGWWFHEPLGLAADSLFGGMRDAWVINTNQTVNAWQAKQDYYEKHGVYPENDPNHPAYWKSRSKD